MRLLAAFLLFAVINASRLKKVDEFPPFANVLAKESKEFFSHKFYSKPVALGCYDYDDMKILKYKKSPAIGKDGSNYKLRYMLSIPESSCPPVICLSNIWLLDESKINLRNEMEVNCKVTRPVNRSF